MSVASDEKRRYKMWASRDVLSNVSRLSTIVSESVDLRIVELQKSEEVT